jgi:hypothetical protein
VLHPHAAAAASLGLEPARRSPDDISSRYSDSEAEAVVDPAGDVAAKADQGDKGIWVEPGSNKGYDSFALDSLQARPTPPTRSHPDPPSTPLYPPHSTTAHQSRRSHEDRTARGRRCQRSGLPA